MCGLMLTKSNYVYFIRVHIFQFTIKRHQSTWAQLFVYTTKRPISSFVLIAFFPTEKRFTKHVNSFIDDKIYA